MAENANGECGMVGPSATACHLCPLLWTLTAAQYPAFPWKGRRLTCLGVLSLQSYRK